MTTGEERVQNEEQQILTEPQPEPPIERKVEQLEQRVQEIESQCANARDRVQEIESQCANVRDRVQEIEPQCANARDRVQEIESQCANVRDRVQGLIARNLAMTEVIRFFEDHAPADAYEATRKLLAMYEKDDAWWTAEVRNKNIWEWAADLAPQHRKKWKKAYDTKFGSNQE